MIGTGLLTVALGLLALDIAGGDDGLVLGTALTIKLLAYIGVAPIIAGLTHRVLPRCCSSRPMCCARRSRCSPIRPSLGRV